MRTAALSPEKRSSKRPPLAGRRRLDTSGNPAGALVVDSGLAAPRLGAVLCQSVPAYWSLQLYPSAAEAGGCFVRSARRRVVHVGGPAQDPERAAAEAARRARGKVRRYCAANRLNRLGTLTYRGAGCHDPRQLRADVADFFRRLRAGVDTGPLPYLWVPEWHPGGHGLHVHFAVGRYVRRSLVASSWGRGFVHIKLLGDLPVGSGTLGEARLAARYLSKYVSKGLGAASAGLHRYELAQGFPPAVVSLTGHSLDVVVAAACGRMRGQPARSWRSEDQEGWQGPPAVWLCWDPA
jgi:hypothetical protein